MKAAREIYQANLDAVTALFLASDLDRIGDHLGIPGEARTSDGCVRLETYAQLHAMLREQRASLRRLGATDYLRVCKSAQFSSAAQTCIDGTHETHILRGGSYVMPPYPCEQQLRLCDDSRWRAFRIACKIRNADFSVIGDSPHHRSDEPDDRPSDTSKGDA